MGAGFVGSMSGMGGGVVLIPALTFFDIDIKQAVAIANLSVITISNSSASAARRHMPNFKVSAFLEVFAVLGALIGASVAVASRRRPLFLLCGVILLGSCWVIWRRQREGQKAVAPQDPFSQRLLLEGRYYDFSEGRTIAYQGKHAPLSGFLMFGAGVISGLLGIGGSALTVLVEDLVMGLPPKVSVSTSNLIIGVMGLAGASVYLEAGLIDPDLAVPVILGVPLGALIGSKLLVHRTNRFVRAIFLAVLIALGLEMIAHGLGGIR